MTSEPAASGLDGATEYDVPAVAAVPITVPDALTSCTVVPAAAVPVRCGCTTLVIPSPSVPVSSAGESAGADGAAGGVARITSVYAPPAALTLPATSTACACTTYVPSA